MLPVSYNSMKYGSENFKKSKCEMRHARKMLNMRWNRLKPQDPYQREIPMVNAGRLFLGIPKEARTAAKKKQFLLGVYRIPLRPQV